MQVDLRYGRGFYRLSLPDDADVTVIRKPPMPMIENGRQAVLDALARPVGAPPLQQIARDIKTVCIAICDITRPVPNHLFLRPLIELLGRFGVELSDITVLVATGLHRPNEGAELAEVVGDEWVLANVRVENHFARRDDDHVEIGTTRERGTVVRLDRRFVQADLRIATGLVEPHFMAGYSGGRKVIAPGLAHAETITTFHNAEFMSHPAATNCVLEGNPLHEDQVEIVEMLGGALAVNTVIDEDRNLSFVNFGEILASHDQAVKFVRDFCEIYVPRRFPTVVTCAAGYPLDKTYYQSVKGIVGASAILEPGGDLIIVSECSEGLGSTEFIRAQQRLIEVGPDRFLDSLMGKRHADIDEWQTQMQLKPMSLGSIYLYSTGLGDADRNKTGIDCVQDAAATVRNLLSKKRDPSIAVIPEGPYVVPFHRELSPINEVSH